MEFTDAQLVTISEALQIAENDRRKEAARTRGAVKGSMLAQADTFAELRSDIESA